MVFNKSKNVLNKGRPLKWPHILRHLASLCIINIFRKYWLTKGIFFTFMYDMVYTTDDWQFSCTSYKRRFSGNHFGRSGYVRNDLASHSRLHPWRAASCKGKIFKFVNFKTSTLSLLALRVRHANFWKTRSKLILLCFRMVAGSKFHTEDSGILGAAVQNSVARKILPPGFVFPYIEQVGRVE